MKASIIGLVLLIGLIPLICVCRRDKPGLNADFVSSSGLENIEDHYQHEAGQDAPDDISYLEETARIEGRALGIPSSYFERITSICLDPLDNIYIADSGTHRIHRFDDTGRYSWSVGGGGQGPGEFMGTMRLSIGRDGKLYVSDDGNCRLLVYTLTGDLLKQFPIDKAIHDVPAVNSNGGIFLLSASGLRIIDYFSSDMRLMGTIREPSEKTAQFHPRSRDRRGTWFRPFDYTVRKIMTDEDELILVSNLSLEITILDQHREIVANYPITNPFLLANYKKRLKDIADKGGWIFCFTSAFLDNHKKICLGYFNSEIGQPEIYRYSRDGRYIGTLRLKDFVTNSTMILSACDKRGRIYAINSKYQCVSIYSGEND